MAAPLLRLSMLKVIERHSRFYIRYTVLLCSEYSSLCRNFNTYREKDKSFKKSIRDFLTYATVFGSIAGYVLYDWKSEERRRYNDFFKLPRNFFPTIYAKSFIPTEISYYRDKFNFIADVVETTAPTVVYIEIKDQKRIDIFTGKPATTSNGSGFIVQEDGLILTNAHVVVNKPNTKVQVNVRLHDGSVHSGIVEDVDLRSDLATVRINKKNLPVMKLGSSANIRPGEFVVAIGSPLALSNTITSGVVSSVDRQSEELGIRHKQMKYIQTDAAITFGNSGGPLVNLNGEAIGINAMKVTAGISFAIPIDYAKDFLQKAEVRRKNKGAKKMNSEHAKKRYLGITMLTLTSEILLDLQQHGTHLPLTLDHGVLIWKVLSGSPAAMGGLKPGDIITHINGESATSANDIYHILEKPGKLLITVVRQGLVLSLTVEPEDIF